MKIQDFNNEILIVLGEIALENITTNSLTVDQKKIIRKINKIKDIISAEEDFQDISLDDARPFHESYSPELFSKFVSKQKPELNKETVDKILEENQI